MTPTAMAVAADRQLPDLAGWLEAEADFARMMAGWGLARPVTIEGVWGSACALVAAALARRSKAPLVVVFPTSAAADDLTDDLANFAAPASAAFPAWEGEVGESPLVDETYAERMRTLKALLGRQPPRIVRTSIAALLQPVPSRAQLSEHSRLLRRGKLVDPAHLSRWLVDHGFHATSAVELPGEFAARGGIFDIYGHDAAAPIRVELFGDEIESIRQFDIATQRSLEALEAVEITGLKTARGDRAHFGDFLPADSRILLVEPDLIAEEARQFLTRVSKPDEFHSPHASHQILARFPTALAYGLAPGGKEIDCRLPLESVERFSGDVAKVRDELEAVGHGRNVYIVVQNEAEATRLSEIFASSSIARDGRLHFPLGRLKAGFRLNPLQLVLLSASELFHRTDLRRTVRRPLARAIDSFLDLREGDLVVHLAHGIARYRGLKLMDKQGQVEEHLELEFHGGTRIFVPVTKIDLVQKYVGGNKARPALAKLGNKTWVRQKNAAAEAATDLAADMLELQALRQARAGISFGADTDWQREFDAAFPYQETPDQLTAVEAIKSDMRSPRPMDRLLCGDVGFGKTELAMRAAFKAADQGYQVAVLAPTTILAEQHYRTFKERMAEFPFSIGKLSRFASPHEQRETLRGLREGGVDIVIGTHRLASADVQFHNLGLVIIDEEQRFGVEVKEKLKGLRTTVDVLTMTATPIPRTLHFSLVGLRDISNLETPPADRTAVETRVCRFDPALIRHAVLRELARGGQIYFVHNRVNDIHVLAAKLQHIVPEARVRIGHGQMPEDELEQVMLDFVEHKFDLLLATTIVESGLDIPNANTIFIDEAERYGLSDLHQLRGRVGRYKHRAYCYLLVDPAKHLTPNAARRLRAIEEFSDMGAGFAIAMRDLEIRGAGNILGTQQSGHIALVGYELYCNLLEDAVRRMKKMPPRQVLDVTIDLPGEAYLPRDYVPDLRLKIDLYRRLCRLATDAELSDLRAELLDRFGPLPEPVARLLRLAELKIDAGVWQVDQIALEPGYLVLGYVDRRRIEQLAKRAKGNLRVVDDRNAYVPLPKAVMSGDELIELAKSVLRAP